MRIATFNIEHLGLGQAQGVTLDSRIEALRPVLERVDADVLCLQEVDGDKVPGAAGRQLAALDRLVSGTPYESFERHVSGETGGRIADVHNLVTLSRFPIAGRREIRHALVPPVSYRAVTQQPPSSIAEPVRFDRPALCTEIGLPGGRRLHVLNLHLRAPLAVPIPGQKAGPFVWQTAAGWAEGFFLAALKRSAQALEIRLAIDDIFDADPAALLILAGDCNAEAHEVPLTILTAAEENTGNGTLAGRALVDLARSIPEDRRFSVLHHGRALMLDHVLASRGMLAKFRALEIHNEALGDELVTFGKVHASPGSTHAPVVAVFDIDPDGQAA
jgi:endonuclease/exonuclease/phosphatase family metal-dependent hydrolase